MATQLIKNFSGRTIAKIDTLANGDKVVRDFYGKRLGTYDKKSDVTRDFYGKIIAHGDACGMLYADLN